MGCKILVCGGRDFTDKETLFRILDQADSHLDISSVIHGAARGADSLAGQWAKERDKKVFAFPANWDKEGKAAGPIRNSKMLDDHPDILFVVAFQGGRGTQDMITKAKKKGIITYVYT